MDQKPDLDMKRLFESKSGLESPHADESEQRARLEQPESGSKDHDGVVETVQAEKASAARPASLKSLEFPHEGPDAFHLMEIERAIEALEDESKAQFLEALEQVPDLVKKESNPLHFLRCHSNDPVMAARRLVAYWQKRVQVYGKRAMKPISQTGEGTLNRGDIAALSSGVFLNLPCDKSGNPVIVYDASKVSEVPKDALTRVAFYMLSVAAATTCSGKDKGLVIVLRTDNDDCSAVGLFHFIDILEVFPVRVEAAHVVTFRHLTHPDQVSNLGNLKTLAQATVGTIPENRFFVHVAFSRTEVIHTLETYGLSQLSLPKSLGGQWGVERLVEWMELRTRFEWNLPPATSHKGVHKIFDFSGMKQPSQLSEEDRIERSRRMNVLHSRRKRERIEIEVLHEHCDELRSKRECLVHEHNRLESLLQASEIAVSLIESGVKDNVASATKHRQEQQTTLPDPDSRNPCLQDPMMPSAQDPRMPTILHPVFGMQPHYGQVPNVPTPAPPAQGSMVGASVEPRRLQHYLSPAGALPAAGALPFGCAQGAFMFPQFQSFQEQAHVARSMQMHQHQQAIARECEILIRQRQELLQRHQAVDSQPSMLQTTSAHQQQISVQQWQPQVYAQPQQLQLVQLQSDMPGQMGESVPAFEIVTSPVAAPGAQLPDGVRSNSAMYQILGEHNNDNGNTYQYSL